MKDMDALRILAVKYECGAFDGYEMAGRLRQLADRIEMGTLVCEVALERGLRGDRERSECLVASVP